MQDSTSNLTKTECSAFRTIAILSIVLPRFLPQEPILSYYYMW